MIPLLLPLLALPVGLSRIRGGDPDTVRDTRQILWVFPAYAGVIPPWQDYAPPRVSLSRIRGGDPTSIFVGRFWLRVLDG